MKVTLISILITLLFRHVYTNIQCHQLTGEEYLYKQEEFKSFDYIGKGGFGLIRGDNNIVIKQILLKDSEQSLINKEIRAMDSFKDQFDILQFYDDQSCQYSFASYIHIVLYYKIYRYETDLLKYTRANRISIFKQLDLMIKMTLALYKFHIQGFIHADLKLENYFLMNEYTVVLADFGLSLSLFEKRNFSSGTPGFIAPEVSKRYVRSSDYTTAIDIYSQGIIFLEMITGNIPKYPMRTVQYLQQTNCEVQSRNQSSSKVFICMMMQLIEKMIQFDVKKRIQAEAVIRTLLKILKFFKQHELIAFNKILNDEYKYYRSINNQSMEVEQKYKDQLLEKFEIRKKIFFQDDFVLQPTVLNDYVRRTDRVPNEYKNLDQGLEFIPRINYNDRMIANQELQQAKVLEEERLRRIQEQNQVNLVNYGIAYAGEMFQNIYNLIQPNQDNGQQQIIQTQISDEADMDIPEFSVADEDTTNMIIGNKQPQLLKKLNPQQRQKIKESKNAEYDLGVDSSTEEIGQEMDAGQEKKYVNPSQNILNFNNKKFKEDQTQNLQAIIKKYDQGNQPNKKLPSLQQILYNNPPKNFIHNQNDYKGFSPRNQPQKIFQNEQKQVMNGYGSDDQKQNRFFIQKPQKMFIQPKKKTVLQYIGKTKLKNPNMNQEQYKIII